MELIKETEQLIRDFNRILKLTWFYSPSHPTVKDTLQKVAAQLYTIVPSDSYLLFNISGDNLFLGAIPLSTKDENVRGFIRQLKKRRINSLLFYPGVGLQELEGLITVLALDPKLLRKQGGIKPSLASREITHIDVTEYQYQPGSPGSEAFKEDTTTITMLEATPERIAHIIQYLQGTVSELDALESQLLIEFMNDPMRIAELQAQAVQQVVQPEPSASVSRLGEITRNVLTRVYNFLDNLPDEEKGKLQRKIALSLLHQDPAVAVLTITIGKQADLNQFNAIKQVLDNLDDAELINLIIASESERHTDLEEISTLFYQLPIDSKRTEELISKYMDLLVKRRGAEEDEAQFIELQQELNQYPSSRMVTLAMIILLEILEKNPDSESLMELLQALQTGTNQLLEIRKFGCLYDIYRTMYRLSQSTQPGEKTTELDATQQKYREFYLWLTDPQVINRLLTALETNTTQPVEPTGVQYFSNKANLTATSATPIDISELEEQKTIVEILAFIGTPVIPGVMAKLNKISVGHPIYQSLHSLLVRFGDTSVPHLESAINLESERMQEQVLLILGQIGTARAQTALINMIPRLTPTSRKQAVSIISQFTNNQSFHWLVNQFKNEPNPEIRVTVLDGITKINTPEANNFLITLATQRKSNKQNRIFQQQAIQSLGKQKIAAAVPSLIKLFHQKSWLFAKQLDAVRIDTARALAQIGTAEAIEVVRQGCTDKRSAVCNACQILTK